MSQYTFQQVTEAIDIALAQSSDLYTKQIARLESEVAALRAEVEGMREDAENYRFLCADLDDPVQRMRRNDLLERMPLMGQGAICAAINAIRKGERNG